MSQMTMTITVSQEVKEEIEALAMTTGRDTSSLCEEALRQYLELQAAGWQRSESRRPQGVRPWPSAGGPQRSVLS